MTNQINKIETTVDATSNNVVTGELQEVNGMNTDRLQGNDSAKQQGQFVLDGQPMTEGFRNVSKLWSDTDNCFDWDTLKEIIQRESEYNHDDLFSVKDVNLILNDEADLVVETPSGHFLPSSYVQGQIGGSYTDGLGKRLSGVAKDSLEKEMIGELFIKRWNEYQKSVNPNKRLLIRSRVNGDSSIRAILSDQYQSIPHMWFTEVLERAIPGGMISHFDHERFVNGGGDFLRYNVLIPDSIRSESDSDYGAMESIGNSEIGNGRYFALPSLFRSICMNGCIWGAIKDERFNISSVHKGHKDLDYLADEIVTKLQSAIPLTTLGLEKWNEAKQLSFEPSVVRPAQLYHELSKQLTWTKARRNLMLDAYTVEGGDNATSILNGMTRYAQSVSTDEQQNEIEIAAGTLLNKWIEKPATWETLLKKSAEHDPAKCVTAVSA